MTYNIRTTNKFEPNVDVNGNVRQHERTSEEGEGWLGDAGEVGSYGDMKGGVEANNRSGVSEDAEVQDKQGCEIGGGSKQA
jgi:hypothetical protein